MTHQTTKIQALRAALQKTREELAAALKETDTWRKRAFAMQDSRDEQIRALFAGERATIKQQKEKIERLESMLRLERGMHDHRV